MEIILKPKNIVVSLLFVISFLLIANIFGLISKYYFGHDRIFGLVGLFDFNTEKNIPTLYSSFAIMVCAILLSIIASENRKKGFKYIYWYGLAIIFLFLSIDEIASIHERLIEPSREFFNASGLLFYAWVIPYGIALGLFLLLYLRFLINLPKRTIALFVVSGSIYISGAVGIELIEGLHHELHGYNNFAYGVIYTFEELFEMLGIVVFIYALLSHIVENHGHLTVKVL